MHFLLQLQQLLRPSSLQLRHLEVYRNCGHKAFSFPVLFYYCSYCFCSDCSGNGNYCYYSGVLLKVHFLLFFLFFLSFQFLLTCGLHDVFLQLHGRHPNFLHPPLLPLLHYSVLPEQVLPDLKATAPPVFLQFSLLFLLMIQNQE